MQIKVLKNVLDANDAVAAASRAHFARLGLRVVNVMGSPGAGKTKLLEATLQALKERLRIGVIVGDICTTRDAERLQLDGSIPVVQICTEPFGGECHLGAQVVQQAAAELDLESLDLLLVENVGNLVCPAEFDLGQDQNVVILSVAEGEDKPLKYPLMFRICDVAVLSKTDLLPHLDYDLAQATDAIRAIKASTTIFPLSAQTGAGLAPWLDWLEAR